MSVVEHADPTEPLLDPTLGIYARHDSDTKGNDLFKDRDKDIFDDHQLLEFMKSFKRLARKYQVNAVIADWRDAEDAYKNEHNSTSKYVTAAYRNRSKYFKPKTRIAILKARMSSMTALHGTENVINVSAQNEGDIEQRANASLIQEIVNARFGSKTLKSGVPWTRITEAARHYSLTRGVCVSKQNWIHKTEDVEEERTVQEPVIDPDTNEPIMNPETGQPFMEEKTRKIKIKQVMMDKPHIDVIAPENVLIDPSSDWLNPVQSSPVVILNYPMQYEDLMMMLDENFVSFISWRDDITMEDIRGSLYSEKELLGLSAASEGNDQNRFSNAGREATGPGRYGNQAGMVVDVRECFFRIDGQDYHCYTLGDKKILSDPTPVVKVYPWNGGERPLVMGTDMADPNDLYPLSSVTSWKQTQDEINETANLRMDALKQTVYPTAKVRGGKKVDMEALQRRDAFGVILVSDPTDIEWDRPPEPGQGIFQESNLLNNDFDELAGQFSAGSVESNRQMNETVGGMAMLSSATNSLAEYGLKIWIETWVEPVLSQVIKMEQYFEADENIIAIAGQRAQLWQRFGISEVTDELLEKQIDVSVNVGMGPTDPLQKLARFSQSMQVAMPFVQMGVERGQVTLNYDELFDEIMSKAGFKDGAGRFFMISEQGQQMVPMQQVQQQIQQLQAAYNQQIQQLQGQIGQYNQALNNSIQENARIRDNNQGKLTIAQMQMMSKAMAEDSKVQQKMLDIENRLQLAEQKHLADLEKMEAQTQADVVKQEQKASDAMDLQSEKSALQIQTKMMDAEEKVALQDDAQEHEAYMQGLKTAEEINKREDERTRELERREEALEDEALLGEPVEGEPQ